MAATKVGAEGGDAGSQYQVGMMYYTGRGVAEDYKQARLWLEKAAAQDYPKAVGSLGVLYKCGECVTPSWRRARELYKRAIELGAGSQAVGSMQTLTQAVESMQTLTQNIQEVS